jgi:TP53 regulating kinase-like protein
LSQGAEGRIYLTDLWGEDCIVKERFKKDYRVPQLDQSLTKQRILQEVKSMDRAKKRGVPTPTVYLVDEAGRKIFMEYLGHDALTLKDFLN